MSVRAKYRWRAIAAAKLAEGLHEPSERAAMLQVAKGYLNLSDHIGAHYEPSTTRRSDAGTPHRDRQVQRKQG
jgi:hypothetical protein